MAGELESTPHELVEAKTVRREIAKQRNRAIVPALTEIANEVEARAKSGKLRKELKGLKVSSLLGNLTRIITAIKENAPQVQINNNAGEAADPTWLRANSTANLSEGEKERRRKNVIDAEVEK